MSESGSYYDREQITHLDGSKIFQTMEDQAKERAVADLLAKAWDCEIRSFAALSPIDWFAVKHDRITAILELKIRSHSFGTYPTVYLSVTKWMHLSRFSMGLNCPSLFVVKFQDGVFWARVKEIDARQNKLGGGARKNGGTNDIEPLIEVPVALLRKVSE